MNRLLVMLFIMFISITTRAENTSILGIDYFKVTENKIIAEVMLEMEPALIEYYKKGEYEGTTRVDQIYALRGISIVLSQDHVSEDTYQVIGEVAPDVPLKFLKLDKEKYPNLWHFGNVMRLTKEEADSRWLYRALHGKDYVEGNKK
ncbi:MAG: hypothetical protein OQL19_17755 [Gammaproteobacteria bacterium]|nr:hypothetical protein [Gammaproteobacteria bacterium]